MKRIAPLLLAAFAGVAAVSFAQQTPMATTGRALSLAERTSLPHLRSFVSAMVQADAFGIPVGQVLRV